MREAKNKLILTINEGYTFLYIIRNMGNDVISTCYRVIVSDSLKTK